MCHQAVGLVQADLERAGIVTASITLLPEISRKMRPPRSLSVPFPLGFPFGKPHRPELQRMVLERLLALTEIDEVPAFVDL